MKTAVIDCDSILFTAAHPNKVLDDDEQPIKEDGKFVYKEKSEEEMFISLDELMSSILTKCNADAYIAFIKGKGNYRYQHNSEYKANRPTESPHWWKSLKQYCITKWNAVEVNGIEVDDAVNITRLSITDSFIVALDKDLLSLEGTHYNWRKDEWVTNTQREAEYKFWCDMITGQSGDNIKGIPGKGIKFAEKVLDNEVLLANDVEYIQMVIDEYIKYFGEYKGIQEFHKNYMSLKILESYENFAIPNINKLNNNVEELF